MRSSKVDGRISLSSATAIRSHEVLFRSARIHWHKILISIPLLVPNWPLVVHQTSSDTTVDPKTKNIEHAVFS